jgi:hypothetical protein
MKKNFIITTPVSKPGPLELDCNQVKAICSDLFNEKDGPLWHVYKFAKKM